MSLPTRIAPLHVVVVGGGIGAVETVLALHTLGEAQLRVTLIAPEPSFVLRPLAVVQPFAGGHADALSLAEFMEEHAGRFVRSAVLRVDADAKRVTCATGGDVPYDVLVLALGASTVPAFAHAMTFGAEPLGLNGILADLEQGWSRSVAFVVPRGCTWPLPMYELALMTAEQVWSMSMDQVEVHLVTPEAAPLEIFGEAASEAVETLLRDGHVTLHSGVDPLVERGGRILLGGGADLRVDRVVALPRLEGPRMDGVPSTAHGFIPIDGHGLVDGLHDVYAVGDAADLPVKQGGLACQQADVAAAHIAATAGADLIAPRVEPVLRGRLLTGGRDRFLRRDLRDARGEVAEEALWWPPGKVSGRYLAPYLAARGMVRLPERPAADGVDVAVPLELNRPARAAAD
jgi:sulfide:quinone oxidoreductase